MTSTQEKQETVTVEGQLGGQMVVVGSPSTGLAKMPAAAPVHAGVDDDLMVEIEEGQSLAGIGITMNDFRRLMKVISTKNGIVIPINGEDKQVLELHFVALFSSQSRTMWPDEEEQKKIKAEGEKVMPTCWSNNGFTPSNDVKKPFAHNCATCWNAQFVKTDKGKKVPCRHHYTLLVMTGENGKLDNILDVPFILRVPPTSHTAWKTFLYENTEKFIKGNTIGTHIKMTLKTENRKGEYASDTFNVMKFDFIEQIPGHMLRKAISMNKSYKPIFQTVDFSQIDAEERQGFSNSDGMTIDANQVHEYNPETDA